MVEFLPQSQKASAVVVTARSHNTVIVTWTFI